MIKDQEKCAEIVLAALQNCETTTMNQIIVELPEKPSSGNFHSGPSGDNEYMEALAKYQAECNAKILSAIPRGHSLYSSMLKTETVVRNYAVVVTIPQPHHHRFSGTANGEFVDVTG